MAEAPLKKKGRPRQWPFASILNKMGGSSSKSQQAPQQTPIPQPSLSPLARTQSAPTLQHLQQQMARQSNSPQMYTYGQQQSSPFSPQQAQVAWEELPPLTSNTTTLPAGIADPPVHTVQQPQQQQFSQFGGVANGGNLSNNSSFTFNGTSSNNNNNSSSNVSSLPASPQRSVSPRTTSPRSTPFSPYPTPLQRKTSRGNTLNNSSQNLKNMAPSEPSNTLLKKAATFCMGQNNKIQHPQKYEDVYRQQQQQFNGGSLSRTSSFGNGGAVPPYRSSNNSSAASSLNGSPVNSLPSSPNSSFTMHYPNNRVDNSQGLPSFNEFLSTIPSVKEMTQEETELQAKLTQKELELRIVQQELEKLKIQQKMNSGSNNAQIPILPPVTSLTNQDAFAPSNQFPVTVKPDPFLSRNNNNGTLPALNMRSKFDEDDEEIGNLFARTKTTIIN